MKTLITFEQALKAIENSSAIVIGSSVVYGNNLSDSEDNSELIISLDEEGDETFVFSKEDNLTVEEVDSCLFMISEDGETEQITILAPVRPSSLI